MSYEPLTKEANAECERQRLEYYSQAQHDAEIEFEHLVEEICDLMYANKVITDEDFWLLVEDEGIDPEAAETEIAYYIYFEQGE